VAILAVLFNLIDNLTTFACLRKPIAGFQVVELNPIADWMFKAMGLGPGLVFEFAISIAAIAFITKTDVLGLRVKLAVLGFICLLAAGAGINNLIVMSKIGFFGV
jgi:hypothetical protein